MKGLVSKRLMLQVILWEKKLKSLKKNVTWIYANLLGKLGTFKTALNSYFCIEKKPCSL